MSMGTRVEICDGGQEYADHPAGVTIEYYLHRLVQVGFIHSYVVLYFSPRPPLASLVTNHHRVSSCASAIVLLYISLSHFTSRGFDPLPAPTSLPSYHVYQTPPTSLFKFPSQPLIF